MLFRRKFFTYVERERYWDFSDTEERLLPRCRRRGSSVRKASFLTEERDPLSEYLQTGIEEE